MLDAAGSERAVLYAYRWGGPVAHPLRRAATRSASQALVLYAALATDDASRPSDADHERRRRRSASEEIEPSLAGWGGAANIGDFAPSRAGDERLMAWFAKLTRLSSSPGAMRVAVAQHRAVRRPRRPRRPDAADARPAPRRRPRRRRAATRATWPQQIPGAATSSSTASTTCRASATATRSSRRSRSSSPAARTTAIERALLTILVTDIVGSTSRAAEMGDADWRDLLADHHAAVRREVDRFEGREVKDLGDGFLDRVLRRAEPGAPLRPGDRRGGHAARARGARRPAHRGVRAHRRRRRRHGGAHRRAGRRPAPARTRSTPRARRSARSSAPACASRRSAPGSSRAFPGAGRSCSWSGRYGPLAGRVGEAGAINLSDPIPRHAAPTSSAQSARPPARWPSGPVTSHACRRRAGVSRRRSMP